MVQLVEVEDEHFQQPQPGPEEEEDDFTDTGASRFVSPPLPFRFHISPREGPD